MQPQATGLVKERRDFMPSDSPTAPAAIGHCHKACQICSSGRPLGDPTFFHFFPFPTRSLFWNYPPEVPHWKPHRRRERRKGRKGRNREDGGEKEGKRKMKRGKGGTRGKEEKEGEEISLLNLSTKSLPNI